MSTKSNCTTNTVVKLQNSCLASLPWALELRDCLHLAKCGEQSFWQSYDCLDSEFPWIVKLSTTLHLCYLGLSKLDIERMSCTVRLEVAVIERKYHFFSIFSKCIT